MGNIIRLIMSRSGEIKDNFDIFVDFENCEPSINERDLWYEVDKKLTRTEEILMIIKKYPGASGEIKAAIEMHYDERILQAACNALDPLAHQLRQCYEFGMDIAQIITLLLTALSSNKVTVHEHIRSQQALFKQFAQIIDFILTFDYLKMTKPSIQNDFSFYRRIRSLKSTYAFSTRQDVSTLTQTGPSDFHLSDDDCSRISLFFGEGTPMLKLAGRVISQHHNCDLPLALTSDCLAAMAHICRGLLSKPVLRGRVTKADTLMLCLHVMTGVIVLYDHLDPFGVFRKSSKLDVKSCLRLLREEDPENVERLLNAIRYSTIHFNDETTPRIIKHLTNIA